MAKQHVFECEGQWNGALMRGNGQFRAGTLQGEFSVSREMTGPGVGTNPEELLVAAAHTCYLMTLAALLGAEGVSYTELSNSTSAIFDSTPQGPVLVALQHAPVVRMAPDARMLFGGTVQSCMLQAETACMVAKTMAGNVTVKVQGRVEAALETAGTRP